MLKLIPQPKKLTENKGTLAAKAVCYAVDGLDQRLVKALAALPFDKNGAPLTLTVGAGEGEGYTLKVTEDAIAINADSPAAAFYAIQTLKQLFAQAPIPCLEIEDAPDFAHRGFYHDITRGRINTVETIKELIDDLAAMKINSLQLYVEHTFPFKELKAVTDKNGCITPEELEELDAYCAERFIEFIPSLSTFGHLYELLEQPQYQYLRTLKDFKPSAFALQERMAHHTIDPTHEDSFPLIQSLIDQYAPHFKSENFNICCDETFDLKQFDEQGIDSAKLYVEFVCKIINYVKNKGKTVMMWADILNKHPETIELLPKDTVFLNWCYRADPEEKNMTASVANFKRLGLRQILCPGNASWFRLCEDLTISEPNIEKMTELAYEYGAEGILNTNWGDWGHPCSNELAMLSTSYGAARSWNVETARGADFDAAMDLLVYQQQGATALVRKISALHKRFHWRAFCQHYYGIRKEYDLQPDITLTAEELAALQADAKAILTELQTPWKKDSYRRQMILAVEGTCLIAEITAAQLGVAYQPTIDREQWLADYSAAWREVNKESELYWIEGLIRETL